MDETRAEEIRSFTLGFVEMFAQNNGYNMGTRPHVPPPDEADQVLFGATFCDEQIIRIVTVEHAGRIETVITPYYGSDHRMIPSNAWCRSCSHKSLRDAMTFFHAFILALEFHLGVKHDDIDVSAYNGHAC